MMMQQRWGMGTGGHGGGDGACLYSCMVMGCS
jgi:hypothetical protein